MGAEIEVGSETSKAEDVRHGRTTVNAMQSELCPGFPCYRGILVKASPSNEGVIYIGTKGVTADDGPRGGYPLVAGESVTIPVKNPEKLWVIADQDGQLIAWIGG